MHYLHTTNSELHIMRNPCLSFYILISKVTKRIFINLGLDGVYVKSCHVNLVCN